MAKPIEFKVGTLTAMSAVLREVDNVRLADALQVMLGGMGEFFAGEPTIIDISQAKSLPDRVDWSGLQSLLRRYGLQPVALRGAPEHLHDAARRSGLAVLGDEAAKLKAATTVHPVAAPVAEVVAEPAAGSTGAAPAPADSLPPSVGTMVVDRTIRSGQQIYAKGADLVILGAVSNGAEVIADGSIHCYGPLRGRAIAGAAGNRQARIFTTNFGPELISVAGVFRTFEKGIPAAIAGKPTQAQLRGEDDKAALVLDPLKLD
ncbi:septum site-determining protein MinC [Uliginosibacterium sp. TH139]|uniref:septum site-determining protein MinC n=1 Tax=Uliginosibacterium sp. TH139 TaxID=2067453 RepID=UPI000C7961FC|nr:septum site-determining protein MinC [Uliginosibacterium sp. TH139]PLK47657.1 septum site-determining protein MinC [Uliginosibacterium sp. TH139]